MQIKVYRLFKYIAKRESTKNNLTNSSNNPFKIITTTTSSSTLNVPNRNLTAKNSTKQNFFDLGIDKDINVSNIIAAENASFTEDLLINNKDEQLLSELNDEINIDKKINSHIKLELEEILDDRWTLFSG